MSNYTKMLIMIVLVIAQFIGVLFFDMSSVAHTITVQFLYIIIILGIVWYKEKAFYLIGVIILLHVLKETFELSRAPYVAIITSLVQISVAYIFYYIFTRFLLETSRVHSIVEATNTGTWEWNMVTNEIVINKEWAAMVGYTVEELEPTTLGTWIHLAHPDDLKQSNKVIEETIQGKRDHYEIEIRMKHKEGHYIWVSNRGNITKRDAFGKAMVMVGTHHDITEQKKKHEEITYISVHDYLTGLYNRRYFSEALEKYNKEEHYPLGLFIIDFNGLKILNDAFGHEVGDIALKKVSKIFKDIFPSRSIICRIGGDEFSVVIPKVSKTFLESKKEELLKVIEKEKVKNIPLSLAIGYDVQMDINLPIGEVLISAESQMYKNKLVVGKEARNIAIQSIYQTLLDTVEIEKEHAIRVADLSVKIGIQMNLNEYDLEALKQASLYHDIGKITIPKNILLKPAKLTEEEQEIMREHTENGYLILRAADQYSAIAKHALYHHEWYNGKGYPEGIRGVEIPLLSRIIAIADAFDQITSLRPYNKIKSYNQAAKEIENNLGSQFDPKIGKIFLSKVLPSLEE